jgi:hypothetical protein
MSLPRAATFPSGLSLFIEKAERRGGAPIAH